MQGVEQYIHGSGLEESLIHLIKMRASQINGCAYCLDMHWKDLKSIGETDQRLYELNAWEETPFYTDRERAALAWTEAVTLVAASRVPDKLFEEVRKQFTEKELADLTVAIAAINAWNRVCVAGRVTPEHTRFPRPACKRRVTQVSRHPASVISDSLVKTEVKVIRSPALKSESREPV